MKKITTIFALTLSLMLTVAFTPSFAFAGDNSAAQNSGNKYTAVDEITGATENEDTIDDGEDIEEDTEEDIDFGDPIEIGFAGKFYQKTAYEILALFNAGYGTTNDCKVTWNKALEKYALQRAADQAIYYSGEYTPDGTDDLDGYGNDDEGVLSFVAQADTAAAAYKALNDALLADDEDITDDTDVDDTDVDDTDDTDVTDDTEDEDIDDDSSPEFVSMAAAKFVAGGKTYWYIAISDTAAKSKSPVNKNYTRTVAVSAGSNIMNVKLDLDKSTIRKGKSTSYSVKNTSKDGCTVSITSPKIKCSKSKIVKISSSHIKGLKKGTGTLKLGTLKIGTITVY